MFIKTFIHVKNIHTNKNNKIDKNKIDPNGNTYKIGKIDTIDLANMSGTDDNHEQNV